MSLPEMDKATPDQLKEKTARLSVISCTGLILMKFVVGFAIDPVSIISEAIHSSMDLIAAVIAFFRCPVNGENCRKKDRKNVHLHGTKKPCEPFFVNPANNIP
jgi:Co/Zn/Cd efflux system component